MVLVDNEKVKDILGEFDYNKNQYAGLDKWRIPSLGELKELLSTGVEGNGDILKALNL